MNEKISENTMLQNEVNEKQKLLEAQRTTQLEGQLATSMNNTQEPLRTGSSAGTTPSEGSRKQYAEVASGKNGTSYKLTVRTKENESTETVKSIIKTNIDPTHMKIGIRTLKGMQSGKVITEANTEEEIEALQNQIMHKCGDKQKEENRG